MSPSYLDWMRALALARGTARITRERQRVFRHSCGCCWGYLPASIWTEAQR